MAAAGPLGHTPGFLTETHPELDHLQDGDEDTLEGLSAGVSFAWQEIQQLMEGTDGQPLSDSLLEACADAALDGASLDGGATPLLSEGDTQGVGSYGALKRQWVVAAKSPYVRPRPQAPPLMLTEHEQARPARPRRAPAPCTPAPRLSARPSQARRPAPPAGYPAG